MKARSQRIASLALFLAAGLAGDRIALSSPKSSSGHGDKEKQRLAVQAVHGMHGHFMVYNQANRLPLGILPKQAVIGDDFFDAVKRIEFQRAHEKVWTADEFRKFGRGATAEQLRFWEP